MNIKLLLTLAGTLLAAWLIFHFKAELGLLVLPLFFGLVTFVTIKLYRIMEKDEPSDPQ